jgi:hypothetical protein
MTVPSPARCSGNFERPPSIVHSMNQSVVAILTFPGAAIYPQVVTSQFANSSSGANQHEAVLTAGKVNSCSASYFP